MSLAANGMNRWPALVLAAGLGTRLRPLSSVRAKAALPVGGDILIRRILRGLRAAGVTRVVVNLHHKPETITRQVGDGRDLDLEVRYSWEDPVLGSAGGPRRALPLLEAERFLIVNGDTLTDVDIAGVVREHETSGALVTMAVVAGDTARYGGVAVDAGGAVARFTRSGQAGIGDGERLLHFIGVQAVEARAFAEVPMDRPSETVRWLYPQLIADRAGSVRAHVSQATFLDIGTPRDYLATARLVASQESLLFDRGRDVVIEASARLERSIVWDRVRVGAGAILIDCVVADDVVVPEGARYEGQVIVDVAGELVASPL